MKIGLFGGTFDPPHIAHLAVAEAALTVAGLSQVVWMPAPVPPHKPDAPLATPEQRLEMTRLAIAGNDRFVVSDLEIRRDGKSFTVDTLAQLTARNSDDEWFLIVGGDSLRDFNSWREPDKILQMATLVVYERERPGFDDVDAALLEEAILIPDRPLFEISSTTIRDIIVSGQSIRYLVPDRVADYIRANRIYRPELAAR